MSKIMITSEEAFKKCRKLDSQILAAIKAHFETGAEQLENSMVITIPDDCDLTVEGCYPGKPETILFGQLDLKGNLFIYQPVSGLSKVFNGTHSTTDLATILSSIEKAKA